MKRIIKINMLLVLVLACSMAFAQQSPVVFLKGISNRMLSALEHNKSRLRRPDVIHSIVRRVLIPHVDLNRMGASVVGRSYWSKASSGQRRKFINEFTRMVTSTYSSALASYDGDRVLFYPLRGGYGGRRIVHVRSLIVRRNGQRIPMSYDLIRSGRSWRVYDFSVENVSVVRSYRAQFAGVLSSSGMSGLIQRLVRHNQGRRR